jgi:hypothetical protein
MCNKANAQTNDAETFLEKLYFPFDFGATFPSEKNISSGGYIKTGLEYRLRKEQGVFFRFNFDNRNNKFTTQENQTTNVVDGKLTFNDYSIGLGYRFGQKKLKGFGLFQGGISDYNYPVVSGTLNNFSVTEKKSTTPIAKITLGFEYYVAKNAALTIETVYILQTSNSAFWHKSFSTFGISIGLTTTLF